MKKSLPGGLQILMLIISLLLSAFSLPQHAIAQIYEPEGLNLPGSWDGWSNPPTNLALASSTQVSGGRVIKIAVGQTRWQTSFSVAATGADIVGGSYNWLFTSGGESNYSQNK